MQTLALKVEKVFTKVQELGSKLEETLVERDVLAEENELLKTELSKSARTIEQLERKVAAISSSLKMAQSGNTNGSRELKKEIDHYIRAVDQCIEWWHNN